MINEFSDFLDSADFTKLLEDSTNKETLVTVFHKLALKLIEVLDNKTVRAVYGPAAYAPISATKNKLKNTIEELESKIDPEATQTLNEISRLQQEVAQVQEAKGKAEAELERVQVELQTEEAALAETQSAIQSATDTRSQLTGSLALLVKFVSSGNVRNHNVNELLSIMRDAQKSLQELSAVLCKFYDDSSHDLGQQLERFQGQRTAFTPSREKVIA